MQPSSLPPAGATTPRVAPPWLHYNHNHNHHDIPSPKKQARTRLRAKPLESYDDGNSLFSTAVAPNWTYPPHYLAGFEDAQVKPAPDMFAQPSVVQFYAPSPSLLPSRAQSIDSFETLTSSSTGSLLSPIQTEKTESLASMYRQPAHKKSTCTHCHRRKIRCDGIRPCKSCQKLELPCDPSIELNSSSLSDISDGDAAGPSWLAKHLRSMTGPSPLSSLQSVPDAPEPRCLVCLGPQCQETFQSEEDLNAHVKSIHTYSCNWAGCDHPSFNSRNGLIWHVKSEHLLVCPVPGCTETSFQSIRLLKTHIPIAHPEMGDGEIKEWQLSAPVGRKSPTVQAAESPEDTTDVAKLKSREQVGRKDDSVTASKRRCQDQLRSAVEKKTRRVAGTPKSADSPTDLVRNRASRYVETASFPMVFEHAVLPFLTEFMPVWSGPEHVISVTRGRTPQMRRISIMTRRKISRARKVMIAGHIVDLLPDNFRRNVSFVFSEGRIERSVWARGLGKDLPDDICPARNPYAFAAPRMGDSIGIPGSDTYNESTATLGPCLIIDGGSYWLGNFHPFLEAYQSLGSVQVEHPSPQDRDRCLKEAHDAIAPDDNFRLGDLEVSSGFMLNTTRISHDPYWEDNGKDKPLVVMDWALISADDAHANILRRFPSEAQPLLKEPLVKSVSAIVPGASVVSSGRTSGYQRGQICEIPAYISGQENGTEKGTREWFIEEPFPYDNEDAWIRGGIGVEGDSGAAIIDVDTNCLVGQLWGRNRYWGPGPRQTFFTPIADIFDDIQEKCGQETRPQLPQERDDADRYAVYPSCRQCYDLRAYLDSRRSSRLSLQSMIMGRGDADQDQTSIEAISELATPRDYGRFLGIEEIGSSFNAVLSPWPPSANSPGTPIIADMRSPYAPNMDEEDLYDAHMEPTGRQRTRKRAVEWAVPASDSANPHAQRAKRQRAGD